MARMLLESWNALDDMARSIGTSPIPSDKSLKGKAKSIYDKLFYGNNLPSVTPPGEKYRVTLTREELAVLRVVLRHAWSDICDRSAQFKQD
jgi:hypothetical protein